MTPEQAEQMLANQLQIIAEQQRAYAELHDLFLLGCVVMFCLVLLVITPWFKRSA